MADPVVSLTYRDTTIQDRLTQLKSRLGDLTPAMRDIGEFEIFQHDRRFENEVDFRGNPLQPLSRRTLERKKAEGKILKILQRTGLMRSRTAYKVTSDSDSVTITNNDVKARKHQFGIGVPKREIFGINPTEDVPEIIAILEDYLRS